MTLCALCWTVFQYNAKAKEELKQFFSYQEKQVKSVIVKHFILQLLPKLCLWLNKKCSCSRRIFLFWWGNHWDSSKCCWLQTLEVAWKWVDAIGLLLFPSAVVLLEAWAQHCWGNAQFVLRNEVLSDLAPSSVHVNVKALVCLNGGKLDPGNYSYLLCWEENCMLMREHLFLQKE